MRVPGHERCDLLEGSSGLRSAVSCLWGGATAYHRLWGYGILRPPAGLWHTAVRYLTLPRRPTGTQPTLPRWPAQEGRVWTNSIEAVWKQSLYKKRPYVI